MCDVLFEFMYCGVCYSDVYVVVGYLWCVFGVIEYLVVLGYEFVGEVVVIGDGVMWFVIGD